MSKYSVVVVKPDALILVWFFRHFWPTSGHVNQMLRKNPDQFDDRCLPFFSAPPSLGPSPDVGVCLSWELAH